MKRKNIMPIKILFSKYFASIVLLACTLMVFGQNKTSGLAPLDSVSGYVYDAITKKPVVGARISSINSKYSSMTDETGAFKIGLPDFIRTLRVTAPEYSTKEISFNLTSETLKILLGNYGNSNYYSTQITPTGYKRRIALTTAQASIAIEDNASLTINEDLGRLDGQLRTVEHSGTVGSGLFMLIRGINSLNANTQPLVVLDGVLLHNQSDIFSIHQGNVISMLSNLDVNDIASVSVLKDGTSIYGSKGANGVILITTNRGKDLTTRISVSATLASTFKPSTLPMMNESDARVYYSDLLVSDKAKSAVTDQLFLNTDPSYIYYKKYHNNTDWNEGIYNTPAQTLTQAYNINVNGGDEKALYNLSVGYMLSPSVLKQNDFNRLNARFNSDVILSRSLKTSFDISYIQASRKLRNDGLSEAYSTQLNSPAFLALVKSPFLAPYSYANNGELTTSLESYDFMRVANPYAILKYGLGSSLQNNINLNVLPEFTINKHLKLTSQFSFLQNSLSENLFSPMTGVAPSYNSTEGIYSLNHVKSQFAIQKTIISETRLNWSNSYQGQNIEFTGGARFNFDSYEAEYAVGHNTGNDLVREMTNNIAYRTTGGIYEPTKALTYFGVANYSFMDKYYAEATMAVETNSKFGTNAESGINMMGVSWGIFPSLNVAWVVSSEKFLQDIDFVDLLKLRAGIGNSGNDGMISVANQAFFKAVQFQNTSIGLVIHNIANSKLQWETVTKRNIGLDLNLLNDKLMLSADVYSNTTNNLLVQKTLPTIVGLPTYWANDGKLENNGFEFTADARIIQMKDFSFNLGASIGRYANKILSLSDGDYLTTVYGGEVLTAVGQPLGQFYGFQTNGVYATTEEAVASGMYKRERSGILTPYRAGDVKFVDRNKDNIIDEKDKAVIGNSNPEFYGIINAGFKYKNFAAKLLFSYSYGNDLYNYLRSQIESGSTFYNQSASMINRWRSEGQITNIPKSEYGDPMENNRFSDRWIEDGSYLKFKTIELSYDLPLKSTYLQGLKVWASANNIFTWTKYLGADPEFAANNQTLYQGVDTGLLSQSRSIYFGVKINL